MNVDKKILENFDKLKILVNGWDKGIVEYLTDLPIVEGLSWNKPADVLWVYAIIDEENYEGSTNQFGITREGRLVWGYFSHCSCYGYEDYDGSYNNLTDETYKQFEFESIDESIENIIEDRLNKLVELCNK